MTDMLDNGFDAFWAAYPRKVAKDAARPAYANALKGNSKKGRPPATHEEIMAGISNLVGKERTFTPYPATWLNAGQWADEDDDPKPVKTLRSELEKQEAATRAEQNRAHFEYDLGLATKKRDEFNAEMAKLRAKNQVDV